MHTGRNLAITLLAALTAMLWQPLCLHAQPLQYKPNELLVKFKPDISSTARAGLQRIANAHRTDTIGLGNIHRVTLSPDISVAEAMTIYTNHPNVLFAEPNYRLYAQAVPNDPGMDQQWALKNIGQVVAGYAGVPGADLDAYQAWDITRGSTSVIVAVLDTGCDYRHPDLAANIWTNPGEIADNGIDDDNNGFVDDYYGWDFSDNDPDPQDSTGHGTHVAGIIAARGDNSLGISGVAWQARIMAVRFIDAFETGYTSDAIAAIRYASAHGARIINCSWGANDHSMALRDEIANTDALFVCAAGNSGTDSDTTDFYPAGYDADNIIAVAASNQMDQLTYFSNFGLESVDVAAPGIRIYSLQNGRQAIWQEQFTDRDMNGWVTGGTGNTWGIADPPATVDAPALASSPVQNYVNEADTWASPTSFDLTQASAPQLTFRLVGESEADNDRLFVETSTDGTHWLPQPFMMGSTVKTSGISGTVPYWMPVRVDLNPWEHHPQLYWRLRFESNSSITQGGYYLDDFELTTTAVQDAYTYMDGTSMAAAYVSGLAALLLSQDDALTPLELKSVIENSVDKDLNLLGTLASGGRINAFNALTLLNDLSLSASTSAVDRIVLSWETLAPLESQVVIERRAQGQIDFETIALVDAQTDQYEDSSLAPDATYYYRVQAQTIDGRSGYSNQTLATTMAPSGDSSSSGGCFIEMLSFSSKPKPTQKAFSIRPNEHASRSYHSGKGLAASAQPK